MIRDFQDALARRLLLWSVLSIVTGIVLLLFGGAFWRGFGLQALVWGAVDAGIAAYGQRSASRRLLKHIRGGGDSRTLVAGEAHKLRRLLWINTGLDVLYVLGGIAITNTLGRGDAFASGNGWGIMVQGAFLFVFDLLHALAVPQSDPSPPGWPHAFAGPEHQSFDWVGGQPAALLLHGFLGTPAEMHGLGEALRAQGWTITAPLLPGFGSEVETLTSRHWLEWTRAVEEAAAGLKARGHAPLLLVGYSMGASLSLIAARATGANGVVLLAPFSWPEPWWVRPAEFVVRPFLPLGFRPMRKADFNRPQLRQGITNFMPGLDLGDPYVQSAIRDFRVPIGLIDQLRAVSRSALSAARRVAVPVLVVQGTSDPVSPPERTRRLVEKLPHAAAYLEVDSDHDLTGTSNAAWPTVRQAVLDFAARLSAAAR